VSHNAGQDKPGASFFAHTSKPCRPWQPLPDHLRNVASLAALFASAFGAEAEANLAGLLHDLGKYGDLFQRRLRGAEHGIDHWSAGAWLALTRQRTLAATAAIQGHHVGLQQLDKSALQALNPGKLSVEHPLGLRLSDPDPDILMHRFEADGLRLPLNVSSLYGNQGLRMTASAMLDVRLLYSTLADADFLDTDAHFSGDSRALDVDSLDGPPLDAVKALAILTEHLAGLAQSSTASDAVARVRTDVLDACLAAGRMPQGLWTLSAPTGAGKTLAMLAFALQHAIQHDLRRVIFVIPYLSIIEQSARTYRGILGAHFGPDYLLEHHSLSGTGSEHGASGQTDLDGDNEAYRRTQGLALSWRAPLIITTSVQLLESLFSNRPSACRKLHRLARSVILFDEAQTIPDHLAVPTLATLSWLAERYRATVVFSTATQPAFTHLDHAVREIGDSGWQPKEVVPPILRLYSRTKRTQVHWPDLDRPLPFERLASELVELPQVLCIVNLKRHARDLTLSLKQRGAEAVLHLSTSMCPAHRMAVLRLVRTRLAKRMPCQLISTQCVEAGVDVDFPVVYRAIGPLEAIAQAAGRCNRNGRLDRGEVNVFVPEDDSTWPSPAYRQATEVTRMLLKRNGADGLDIDDPRVFNEYYRLLYDLTRPESRCPQLRQAIECQDFAKVAGEYRLIDPAISVLVPYKPRVFTALRAELDRNGPSARWLRKAQPHMVSLHRPRSDEPVAACLIPIVRVPGGMDDRCEWFIYNRPDDYKRDLGLVAPDAPPFWGV
jgi:CRISPR-associated helicase Cas3/CRISPR-associated endonuclease Cas3-HD